MTDDPNQIADDDDDRMVFFDEILWEVMSPKIKEYLFNNYQNILLQLEPEQYTELDELIREAFNMYADEIVGSLCTHRIIADFEEYNKALDNFVPDNKPVQWPVIEHWFFRQFVEEDDEPDDFAGLQPFEMDENTKRAQEVIDICDDIVNGTQLFADFIKQGYLHFNPIIHQYLERCASFDLAFSSPEGIVDCQRHIDTLLECLFEDVHALFYLQPRLDN